MYLKERLNQDGFNSIDLEGFFRSETGGGPPNLPPADEEPDRGGGWQRRNDKKAKIAWGKAICGSAFIAVICGLQITPILVGWAQAKDAADQAKEMKSVMDKRSDVNLASLSQPLCAARLPEKESNGYGYQYDIYMHGKFPRNCLELR